MIPVDTIRLVFSDFDGTLTEGTDFSPFFLKVLGLLHERDIPLVIVTGRSKSWAHFLLTHFPTLNVIISEGGGIISSKDSRGVIVDRAMVAPAEVSRLESFVLRLQERFSELQLTADSFGRETDRAIEIGDMTQEIENFVKENHVNCSTSSVHFNFWCGEISKYETVSFLLKNRYFFPLEECLYFGDSLNDESMFQYFENSVGVSNIVDSLDRLKYVPKVILDGKENRGAGGVFNYLSIVLK